MLIENKENNDEELKENTEQKQQTLREGKQQNNIKYPEWDILPPFQFINPRIKKAE